ncbi:MAG: dihydroorotase [Cyclobacteriaceae bacterium]|nr:dihydroorotase [Cyclobacteriaceae bacterium]
MNSILITNAKIVNEGLVTEGDVWVKGQRIEKIAGQIPADHSMQVIDAQGQYLIPGAIDDQVHFREPGLTHKGNIHSESRAAVAGGVTSFMEMPNTSPPTFTQELLEAKYRIAAAHSPANYSFFIGASNDNLAEVLKTDLHQVCGLKIFMGSSTGNLLVDDPAVLDEIFSRFPGLIATHCEDEPTIRHNLAEYKAKYGDDIPVQYHPLIRSEEGCYRSSSLAISLARKHGTRLHILHISTARETSLFDNTQPLHKKRITAEACIHHLWFNDQDYTRLGNLIKWNPAIKTADDQAAIMQAVLDNRIDIIATDHAPHTSEEKGKVYTAAPSGGPLVQHSVVAMFELARKGGITIPRVVEKMSHAPATCFRVIDRGYIREGYFADLALVDANRPWTVSSANILAHCGWSPFEGTLFHSQVTHTLVSGRLVWQNGALIEGPGGCRLTFKGWD